MNTFVLILAAVLAAAVAYFILNRNVLTLPPSTDRKVLAGATAAGTVILMAAFVICAVVPGKSYRLMSSAIDSAEKQIEAAYPGYTDTVIDKSEFEAFINGSMEASRSTEEQPVLSMALDIPGIGAVKSTIDTILGGTDSFMAEFDETGTPFTLHNIMISLQEKAKAGIRKSMGIAGTVITIIAVLFYLGTVIAATGIRKGWFEARNSSLNFGDGE